MTKYVIVDTETSALEPEKAFAVEISALVYDPDVYAATGGKTEIFDFVPHHTQDSMRFAEAEALAINRYYERGLWKRIQTEQETRNTIRELVVALRDATLVGANPHYDAQILGPIFMRYGYERQPQHYRMYDVQAATAGRFALPTPPSLPDCAKAFGIPVDESRAHSSLGDVHTTFKILRHLLGHVEPATSTSVTQ